MDCSKSQLLMIPLKLWPLFEIYHFFY